MGSELNLKTMSTQDVLAAVDRAYGAVGRGDDGQAEHQFLLAARGLLGLARGSHGELRDTRMQQARRLMAQAQQLVETTVSVPAVSVPAVSMAGRRRGTAVDVGVDVEGAITPILPSGGFDDVAGMQAVKDALYSRFLFPLEEPELAARYLQKAGGGLLLYGPPGTGKTHLVRALAGEIGAPVFVVDGANLLSKYLGEAEQRLAEVFRAARRYPRAVIFIDEINGLTPSRDQEQNGATVRVVDQLLSELDGFEQHDGSQLVFIGATNHPDKVDPALLRPGRFDELIYLGVPDLETRAAVLTAELDKARVGDDINLADVAVRTDGFSIADLKKLVLKAAGRPYAELIRTGHERTLDMADFEAALSEVRSSIRADMLVRYERFQNGDG